MKTMIRIITHSPAETRQAGERFAKLLESGGTAALTGELGSGKTVFIKGIASALGIKQEITSPTFVLVKPYQLKHKILYHFDLYRLEGPVELNELGFTEIVQNPDSISVIEWAERAKSLLPKDRINIKLSHGKKPNDRIIKITHPN